MERVKHMNLDSVSLEQNEVVTFQQEAGFGDDGTWGTLVITNTHLRWVEKPRRWKKSAPQSQHSIPLSSICESGGIIKHELYVDEATDEGMTGSVRIYTNDGASYRIWLECYYNDFLDVLNVLNYKATGITQAFKIETIVEGKIFKKKTKSIVVNSDTKSNIGPYARKVVTCPGCGAKILGYSGLETTCEYCHTVVVL